jgi:hypothetical protein
VRPAFTHVQGRYMPRADRPASTLTAAMPNVHRTVIWSLLAALTVTTLPGCGRAQELHSSESPLTVICGTTLNDTPAGAAVTDATHQHATITAPSVRGLLFKSEGVICATARGHPDAELFRRGGTPMN